ncbi:MAG: PEP-CTERM sorting domain-containing protein [Planctomycetia bacterium]
MRIQNSCAVAVAAAVAAVVFSAAFQPAEASLVFIFDESTPGTIVVRGSGSVNTTALGAPNYPAGTFGPGTPSGWVYPDLFALGSPYLDVNGWISEPPFFNVIQGDDYFFNTVPPGLAPQGPTSGSPMELSAFTQLPPAIALDAAYVSGSPLANTTTLTGYTRAQLGYDPLSTWANPKLEGTWTLHNLHDGTPTGDTISIYSVPEPSTMVFVAGAGVILGAWRMRKLRRGRPAAGEALAC